MLINVPLPRGLSIDEQSSLLDSYTDLGWEKIATYDRPRATDAPPHDLTGGYTLQWSHDGEPKFPENANYTIRE